MYSNAGFCYRQAEIIYFSTLLAARNLCYCCKQGNLTGKIKTLEKDTKNKIITDKFRSKSEFKKSEKPRTNIIKNVKNHLLAYYQSVVKSGRNSCQFLKVSGVNPLNAELNPICQ